MFKSAVAVIMLNKEALVVDDHPNQKDLENPENLKDLGNPENLKELESPENLKALENPENQKELENLTEKVDQSLQDPMVNHHQNKQND